MRCSRRSDGRCTAVYTLTGQQQLEKHCLPLLKQPVLTNKCKKRLIPWLEKHFPQFSFYGTRNISGDWLAGFTDGDGSFHTLFRRQADYKCGFQFQAVFDLTQKEGFSGANGVLKLVAEQYFSTIPLQRIPPPEGLHRLRIVRPLLLHQHVLPLFSQSPLRSRKEIQFLLWKEAVQGLVEKRHLHLGGDFREKIISYRERWREWTDKPSARCRQWMQGE